MTGKANQQSKRLTYNNMLLLPLPLKVSANKTSTTQQGPMMLVPEAQKYSPRRKPPPATRHRAVMSLLTHVLLYDMRSQTSSSLQDVIESSCNAEKVMLVMTICTDRVTQVKGNLKYLELSVTFYSYGESQSPKLDVKVIMPEGWTPKMYLSALNKSIRKNSLLSLESICIDGRIYTTINELQWLFSATEESTHSLLICLALYICVSGGVLKSIK